MTTGEQDCLDLYNKSIFVLYCLDDWDFCFLFFFLWHQHTFIHSLFTYTVCLGDAIKKTFYLKSTYSYSPFSKVNNFKRWIEYCLTYNNEPISAIQFWCFNLFFMQNLNITTQQMKLLWSFCLNQLSNYLIRNVTKLWWRKQVWPGRKHLLNTTYCSFPLNYNFCKELADKSSIWVPCI